MRLRITVLVALILMFSLSSAHADALAVQDDPAASGIGFLKDEEWARIKRMDRAARVTRPFLEPAYLQSVTLERMLAYQMTPYGINYRRLVDVTTTEAFTAALANAQPGDFIHLADGIYAGGFEASVSGTRDAPIIVYGSRDAIIEGESIETGYGFHLTADHWILGGFTVRNVGKGIVTDGASFNLLQGLEIYRIGDEGVHFRSASSDNMIRFSWIHDVGLANPEFGEGVYIGSAVSNWAQYSNGLPDASDSNQVINNLLGPNITAEAVDVKEGTTGGVILNNSFILTGETVANSWIDIKGNGYRVEQNSGLHPANSSFINAVDVLEIVPGWGQGNSVEANTSYPTDALALVPVRLHDEPTGAVTIVMPARLMPYTLSELIARFPGSFEHVDADTILLKEHVLAARGALFTITTHDIRTLRLLSTPESFVGIATFRTAFTVRGSAQQRIEFVSWDLNQNMPDVETDDGRAYVFASGGRMDIEYGSFADLGFTEGTMSGVAWQGYNRDEIIEPSRGTVTDSLFIRNYFGAYTYEAVEMLWIDNVWADNILYGFDPHDYSNDFLVEGNSAYGNGSHGIIFSRGCHRNIIRDNDAYDNAGNGIMLDDGKVIADTEIVRYQLPVPSNDNIVENNRMWNNSDGIVLEGGERNVVRNNAISGVHRFGIRLKDNVTGSLVSGNTIETATDYGIFIYESSDDNQIIENTITATARGIVIRDSTGTVIVGNVITDISSAALSFSGAVTNSVVEGNTLAGSGFHAINTSEATGIDADLLVAGNTMSQWSFTVPSSPNYTSLAHLSIWVVIFAIPILMRPIMYMRKIARFSRSG